VDADERAIAVHHNDRDSPFSGESQPLVRTVDPSITVVDIGGK
jgi:hypothetical protein